MAQGSAHGLEALVYRCRVAAPPPLRRRRSLRLRSRRDRATAPPPLHTNQTPHSHARTHPYTCINSRGQAQPGAARQAGRRRAVQPLWRPRDGPARAGRGARAAAEQQRQPHRGVIPGARVWRQAVRRGGGGLACVLSQEQGGSCCMASGAARTACWSRSPSTPCRNKQQNT